MKTKSMTEMNKEALASTPNKHEVENSTTLNSDATQENPSENSKPTTEKLPSTSSSSFSATDDKRKTILYLKTFCQNTFDVRLFLNVYVWLFFLASLTMSLCSGIPYNFLPVKCVSGDGLSEQQAALIIGLMGLADVMGRVIFGALGTCFNVTVLYGITCAIVGTCVMSLSWTSAFIATLIAATMFAFGQGKQFNSLYPFYCYCIQGVTWDIQLNF